MKTLICLLVFFVVSVHAHDKPSGTIQTQLCGKVVSYPEICSAQAEDSKNWYIIVKYYTGENEVIPATRTLSDRNADGVKKEVLKANNFFIKTVDDTFREVTYQLTITHPDNPSATVMGKLTINGDEEVVTETELKASESH